MNVKDIQIDRLTRNLRVLSAATSARGVAGDARRGHTDGEALAEGCSDRGDEPTRKPRAAVVTWDLGHNPAGRAHVLYRLLESDWDVELIGPHWTRYGDSLWEPLQSANLTVRSFQCRTFEDFMPSAEVFAAANLYDLVYVCKPRFPSVYLGALIKDSSACPLVLDVDDFEPSFFLDESFADLAALEANLEAAFDEPYGELATRFTQTLIPAADAVTVSNVALQQRFGGHMVRHARDAVEFRSSPARRDRARARLAIKPNEFALMFIGTPRPHKGVFEVARALHQINDPTIVFHVIGEIQDAEFRRAIDSQTRARIVFHPNCGFAELPDLLAGADLVPLIQSTGHAISQYQIPAKVSDALALGVPVLATHTAPLSDLIAAGSVESTTPETLADDIIKLRSCSGSPAQYRRAFLGELSLSVNKVRLGTAIDEARECHDSSALASATDDGALRLPHALCELIELCRRHYRTVRTASTVRPLEPATLRSGTDAKASSGHPAEIGMHPRSSQRGASWARLRGKAPERYDIAYFWKQNDSGLYGRRSDMIVKYLLESGRVNRLIQFDAPMSVSSLVQHFKPGRRGTNGQQDLILRNLVDRQMGVFDTGRSRQRTFLHAAASSDGRLLSQSVGSKLGYAHYVREQLTAFGMQPEHTLAWFCPVVWEAEMLIDTVGFSAVVADLIDDQRAWASNPELAGRLDGCYRSTLEAADLVFANCQSLADGMCGFAETVHVVPNGAERFHTFPDDGANAAGSRPSTGSPVPAIMPRRWRRDLVDDVPDCLVDLNGPIACYVGNLRDRFDWLLMHDVVRALPDVSFVLFGPSNDNANADTLAQFENVHVPGVLPYDQLAHCLRCVDVGLVPHLDNQLTERMNPLKVYNYFAAGLPIVSSDVDNLEDLGLSLYRTEDPVGFASAIREAIACGVDTSAETWQKTMDSIAWDTRVSQMLSLMDEHLPSRARRSRWNERRYGHAVV